MKTPLLVILTNSERGGSVNQEKADRKKERFIVEVNQIFEELAERFNSMREGRLPSSDHSFQQAIVKAQEELHSAELFFHTVSDPDLIDHAIYRLEAAKSRYTYLLKLAKREGIKANFH